MAAAAAQDGSRRATARSGLRFARIVLGGDDFDSRIFALRWANKDEDWANRVCDLVAGDLTIEEWHTLTGRKWSGVVSPLLANLFLHYALDVWLRRHMRSVRFCRYADDGVIHCRSEVQAKLVLSKLGVRLRQCGLELHPQKARIVYCQDVNRKAAYSTIQFTFLGYTFRPRKAVDKYGRVYVNFSPAVSREAMKGMRQTVRGWHVQLECDKELSDLSNMFGPVLRGWSNYYGRFYPSALKPLWRHVNAYLVRWMRRKSRRLARGVTRATRALGRLAERAPRSFVHWEMGIHPRGSMTGAG
jgi:RNA-directed DNA polymerase